LKGVTYGTFNPTDNGFHFPGINVVKKDLEMMANCGFNCLRTYTVPPKYLLDIAQSLHLHVMVGLPWAQHITFLENRRVPENILYSVKLAVYECNAHPAILCFVVGNEIPAPIVRWYGKRKIENFIKSLYQGVKETDP